MIIDATDSRNADVFVALEGELVGCVQMAFVAPKEQGGFVIRATPDGWSRTDGNVAYLGHSWEPRAMHQRRLSEERIRLGLPMPEPIDEAEFHAGQLESLAMKIRTGEVAVTNVQQAKAFDHLPLPSGWQHQPTGVMSYNVDFTHKDTKTAHERAFAEWSAKYPELLAEYVNAHGK